MENFDFFIDFLDFFPKFFIYFYIFLSNVFVKFFVKILGGGVPMGLKTQKYHVFSVQKYHFGGGCPYFSLKHKSKKYTFVQQGVGGSRRDPKHKSMYKCAYMYVHLYLGLPPI